MVLDALQGYAQLASGLTKATRDKAVATAKGLLSQAGLGDVAADAEAKVNKLADELIATSKANRKLLGAFVAAEVDKAVQRLGLARLSDLEALRDELTAAVAVGVAATPTTAPVPETPIADARTTAAPRPAKKAQARNPPAKKAAAASAVPPAPTKKAAVKKSPAKKSPAKKATAKKAAADATGGTTDAPATDAPEIS